MAHDHAHDHEHSHGNYFLDQICTIAICGLLGGVAILMWQTEMLKWILVPDFWPPVLVGGVVLVLLVVVRSVSLWREASKAKEHTHHHHHDHEHTHAHDHEHSHEQGADHHHHEHDHGHDHEHGWTPWRYAVLMLPIVLFFLNLPNQGFSHERLGPMMSGQDIEGGDSLVAFKGDDELKPRFNELSMAATRKQARDYFEGRTAKMKGMLWPLETDKAFTMFRMKMTCCAADAIPLKVRIISPESLAGRFTQGDWVEVRGQIQFRKVKDKEEYVPVIVLQSPDDVKATQPDANEYEV